MVRLVITDFESSYKCKEFYRFGEFDETKEVYTYNQFRKINAFVSSLDSSEFYSLNLFSKKYLNKEEILIYVTDVDFVVLFNHQSIYYTHLKKEFFLDDFVKSLYVARHLIRLCKGQESLKINYVLDTSYDYSIENLLTQNLKEDEVVTFNNLGKIDGLKDSLVELETSKKTLKKNFMLVGTFLFVVWGVFFGIDLMMGKVFKKYSLRSLTQQIKVTTRVIDKKEQLLSVKQKEYQKLVSCIQKEDLK